MIPGSRDHSTPVREALEEWESHSFWRFVLHTPRFTPLSLVLISASVSRTNSSFCLWLSLTAPVLVLAHGLLFLDGSALGISLIFDEASDVLKSMFCFRCSGFVAGGPSESAFLHTALTGHPSCYVHCSCSTLHVLLALPCMGLSTCPAWRECLSQCSNLSISLLPRPGSWCCLIPLVVVEAQVMGKGWTIPLCFAFHLNLPRDLVCSTRFTGSLDKTQVPHMTRPCVAHPCRLCQLLLGLSPLPWASWDHFPGAPACPTHHLQSAVPAPLSAWKVVCCCLLCWNSYEAFRALFKCRLFWGPLLWSPDIGQSPPATHTPPQPSNHTHTSSHSRYRACTSHSWR